MKPVNPQKERIIVLASQMISRTGLSIDQVIARMQVDGCNITRNTFENRFTTRVHQKPNIPVEWLLSFIRALSQSLADEERCRADEALELFQLARLPLDQLPALKQFFAEGAFSTAVEHFLPTSYFSLDQNTTIADNLLTVSVSKLSASPALPVQSLTDQSRVAEWGDAPDTRGVQGREQELTLLQRWIVEESCRLVGIFGVGGIGKTLLAAQSAEQLAGSFDRIYWRSLRDAPPLSLLLEECLHFLLGVTEGGMPSAITKRSDLLLRHLRTERCLLILDGAESLIEAADNTGNYRIGYENYAQWLRQFADVSHKSALLLTSREKYLEFTSLSNDVGPVRALTLTGLDLHTIRHVLEVQGLRGSVTDWQLLYDRYSGNPLALKLAVESINDLFAGDIATFHQSNASLFQNIREMLEQQFGRLSLLEREILYWLVIEQEAVTIDTLQEDIGNTIPKLHLLEALRSLLRRSLVEQSFSTFYAPQLLQSYMLERLVELVVSEIGAGIPMMLAGFALQKSQNKEYLRAAQISKIIHPILDRLLRFSTRLEIERKLLEMLRALQVSPSYPGNYCAGNLFNLLVQFNTDLRGQDFSSLAFYHSDIRTTNLQDVNFANATFHASRFWESFAGIAALAYSRNGYYLAAGTTNGEVHLRLLKHDELRFRLNGHTDMVWSVTFSSDDTLLATGSEDQTVRIWDVASGECLLRIEAHHGWVKSVHFLNGNSKLPQRGTMARCVSGIL
ncbi:MAG: WD40 repeat domain-containing protein [Caldilineaceae bacterium]